MVVATVLSIHSNTLTLHSPSFKLGFSVYTSKIQFITISGTVYGIEDSAGAVSNLFSNNPDATLEPSLCSETHLIFKCDLQGTTCSQMI